MREQLAGQPHSSELDATSSTVKHQECEGITIFGEDDFSTCCSSLL